MEMASDNGRAQPVSAFPRVTVAPGFPLWLRIAFWACIVIAVAAVLRRAAALLLSPSPGAPPQLAGLDAWFVSHAVLTWLHILCAVGLCCLAPISLLDPHQRLACCPARLLPARLHGSSDRLCHERLRGGWMAGAFCRVVFQYALCRLAGAGLPLASTRRCLRKAKMDTSRGRHPARHRHHPPRHGSLLCHCASYAFDTATVLWHRLLDRLLPQHARHGTVAA